MAPTQKRKLTDESPSDTVTEPPATKRLKTHVCHTCEELKPSNQFPLLRDPGHDHDRNTCRSCYQDWLRVQLGVERWDEMLCPECELHLSPHAISKILTAVEYKKYVLKPSYLLKEKSPRPLPSTTGSSKSLDKRLIDMQIRKDGLSFDPFLASRFYVVHRRRLHLRSDPPRGAV